ncbi:MAG: ABC transporter permease [Candidatus Kapaibacterium sp.]
MNWFESIRMAFNSLRSNKLRAGLTLLSMAIGVFAIVGIAAAVGVLDNTVNEQLVTLGRNDFIVQKDPPVQMGDGRGRQSRPDITVRQGVEFKKRLDMAEKVSLFNQMAGKVVKFNDEATNPNITLYGSDELFTTFVGYTVESGRELDPEEVRLGRDVVLIGADVAADLNFDEEDLGSAVRIDGHRYIVVGILASKGSVMGQSQDKLIVVPISSASKYFFSEWEASVNIIVRARSPQQLEETMDEAIGIMRAIRRLQVTQENNFEVVSQAEVVETISGFTKYITFFGMFCGIIALLAAGVGIMNIMLVSVKERTKEIGVRKAIGAKRQDILTQFIIEAVTICQVGAWLGILTGVGVGSLLGLALGVPPAFPWSSILVSTAVCFLIGILFGAYPAWQAARLDPIEALRYE